MTGAAFLLAASLAAVTPALPLGDGYEFDTSASDEFDGGKLDDAKWIDWVPSFPGRSSGFLFARDNVAVRGGKLELVARLMREDEKTVENLRRGFTTYATAYVRLREKTRYGYYECRAKGMKACVCNAFWLYDPLSDQPAKKFRPGDFSEEIDIFEIFGKVGSIAGSGCERAVYTTVHRLRTPYLEGLVVGGVEQLPQKTRTTKVDFDFWSGYHVYGFLWTEKEMKWYVDGQEIFSRPNDFFKRPLHLVFDCEIMYAWTGEPDKADLPQTFSVDYFRFWREK
jgi:beta-glucanase (GH16 family)